MRLEFPSLSTKSYESSLIHIREQRWQLLSVKRIRFLRKYSDPTLNTNTSLTFHNKTNPNLFQVLGAEDGRSFEKDFIIMPNNQEHIVEEDEYYAGKYNREFFMDLVTSQTIFSTLEGNLDAVKELNNWIVNSSQQFLDILHRDVVLVLLHFLKSSHYFFVDTALDLLCQILQKSLVYKQLIYESDGFTAILKLCGKTEAENTIRMGIITLANLCRGDRVDNCEIELLIRILLSILKKTMDPSVVMESMWILVDQYPHYPVQVSGYFLKVKFINFLLKNIEHYDLSTLIAALKIIQFTLDALNKQQYSQQLDFQPLLNTVVGGLQHHKRPCIRDEVQLIFRLNDSLAQFSEKSIITTKPIAFKNFMSNSSISSFDTNELQRELYGNHSFQQKKSSE